MKKILYFSIFLSFALLVGACAKEEEWGSQNKGKERPVASISLDKVKAYECSFTVTPSGNASQYAIAVFNGKDNEVPSAYDIVVDEVSGAAASYAYNVAENNTVTLTLECEPESDYQIFAAAITSTGLLSEVSEITVTTTPKVVPVLGAYSCSYADLGEDVLNEAAGEPFDINFMDLSENEDGSMVLIQANWFNYAPAGYVVNPYLIGTTDYKTQTITFDGSYAVVQNGQLTMGDGSAFGSAFMYYDSEKTMFVVFWGGGDSGDEPVVVSYDDNGLLTDISYCDYTIHNASTGQGLAVFDALIDGRLTPKTESSGVQTSEIPAISKSAVKFSK